MVWTECTKDELLAWVKRYRRTLVRAVATAGEPPQVTFIDYAIGQWPDGAVASYFMKGYEPEHGYKVRTDLMPLTAPSVELPATPGT